MIKITTAIIAVLVVSIATVSVYANDATSEQQATPQSNHNDNLVNGYCYQAGFDIGNYNISNTEICVDWGYSSDGTRDTLSLDRTFYRIGDIVEITAIQDWEDTLNATSAYIGISQPGVYDDDIKSYTITRGDVGIRSVTGVVLTENDFTVGCYTVWFEFDTSRAGVDEAWNERDFCIVPDYTLGTLPPAPTTGVSGKVYNDSNNNGTLDSGEPGVSGRSVITVNMADFTDTNRTSTDVNGDYTFELDIGTYLVQVEGTSAFAYVTVYDGTITTQHFGL